VRFEVVVAIYSGMCLTMWRFSSVVREDVDSGGCENVGRCGNKAKKREGKEGRERHEIARKYNHID
jgi:hypothetical protein